MRAITRDRAGQAQHVVFVLAGLGAGGAERVVSLISGAWVAQRRRVTIISFDRADDPVFHAFDPRVRLVRLGIPAGGIWAQARRVFALRRMLRILAADVTISFLTKINVLTLLASIGGDDRVIVSERNNPQAQDASRAWNFVLAKLQRRASAIVMQTQASFVCLDDSARRRARVINNPIPIPATASLPPKRRVLVAVGRLAHQKGFDLLIDAFALIADRHPEWMLRIWGEGQLREILAQQVADRHLQNRVELPGASHGPGAWVAGATTVVLSSRYEGFCNVLGEAMAAGLPVVAFDCPFSPGEMIEHGKTGLLVPPEDVAGLAMALDRTMGDAVLRRRLGKAARAAAHRFEPETIIAQWDALLDEVTAERA